MSSINYSRTGIQSSAAEVLGAVLTELRQLRASYKEISRRIRVLRSTVDALREFEGGPADDCLDPAWPVSRTQNEAWLHRNVETLPSCARMAGRRTWLRGGSSDLRRACRIALMETSHHPICDEEIYRRIVRRGSFRFADSGSAARAIALELSAMVEIGEIRIVPGPFKRLWQRIPPNHDEPSHE